MRMEGDTLTGEPGNVDTGRIADVRVAAHFDGATGGDRIRAALSDLPASGGIVFVPAEGPDTNGRWDLSGENLDVPDNTALVGVPGVTELYGASILTGQTASPSENVTIYGITLDGGGTNARLTVTNTQNARVERCTVKNGKYGVHVSLSQDVLVDNCLGIASSDDNFTATDTQTGVSSTRNVTFRDCVSRDPDQSGFEVDDGPHNVRFVDCKAYGGLIGFRNHTHAEAAGAEGAPENIYYVRCKSVGASRYGFTFGGNSDSSLTPRGYYVIKPTVRNAGVAAIAGDPYDASSNEATISELRITEPDIIHQGSAPALGFDVPTAFRDVTIRGGVVVQESAPPALSTRGTDIFDFNVRGTTINGAQTAQIGIEIAARDGGRTRGTTIDGCAVEACRSQGIDARAENNDVDGLAITNNIIYNNGNDETKSDAIRSGISVIDNLPADDSNPPPTHVMIAGNRVFNTAGGGPQQYGIYRRDLVDSIVVNNICWGAGIANISGAAGTGIDGPNVA